MTRTVATAVIDAEFKPIALSIAELQSKHAWPLGPGIGGVLLYAAETLKAVGVESNDPLLSMLETMVHSIAEGRAAELIEGN